MTALKYTSYNVPLMACRVSIPSNHEFHNWTEPLKQIYLNDMAVLALNGLKPDPGVGVVDLLVDGGRFTTHPVIVKQEEETPEKVTKKVEARSSFSPKYPRFIRSSRNSYIVIMYKKEGELGIHCKEGYRTHHGITHNLNDGFFEITFEEAIEWAKNGRHEFAISMLEELNWPKWLVFERTRRSRGYMIKYNGPDSHPIVFNRDGRRYPGSKGNSYMKNLSSPKYREPHDTSEIKQYLAEHGFDVEKSMEKDE